MKIKYSYEQVLWSLLLTTMFALIITLIILNCNEHFTENFGSSCIDFIPYNTTQTHPKIHDAIFVSVASYRDDECKDTINSMFKQAKNPDKIFVGVCQQNKEADENCIKNVPKKYQKNIRTKDMSYKEAKGPNLCSILV